MALQPKGEIMSSRIVEVMAVLVALFAACAQAQGYPARPVRIISPSSPGGGSDFVARIMALRLGETLGTQTVVENRPGASSMIGADYVAKAAPDGYTLLVSPAALAVNPFMFANVLFDPRRDLAPISQIVEAGNVLTAHPSVPARTMRELITLAKARPGLLSIASPGGGATPHMAAELFRLMTGADILIVAYKGSGPGAIALLSGEVSLQFSTPPSTMQFIRNGKVRALGVTSLKRLAVMPEVPTIAEAGLPGFEATQWFGLLAPVGTSRTVIERLHQESVRAVRLQDTRDRFAVEGLEPVGSTPDEFAAYIASEMSKWGKVIKAAGIKPQ
jgi:tripartite-type tricarboxylate transporter receptor subunit TctC